MVVEPSLEACSSEAYVRFFSVLCGDCCLVDDVAYEALSFQRAASWFSTVAASQRLVFRGVVS